MRTIAIMNNKGGVGKTVTAIALAEILVADYGKRVVVCDCDGQMNLTRFYAPQYDDDTGISMVDILLGEGEPLWSDNLFPIKPGLDLLPGSTTLYDLDLDAFRSGRHNVRRVKEFVDAAREDGEVDFFLLPFFRRMKSPVFLVRQKSSPFTLS